MLLAETLNTSGCPKKKNQRTDHTPPSDTTMRRRLPDSIAAVQATIDRYSIFFFIYYNVVGNEGPKDLQRKAKHTICRSRSLTATLNRVQQPAGKMTTAMLLAVNDIVKPII